LQRLFSWQLSVLLLAAMSAGAEVNNSSQNGQATDSTMITPGISVTSSAPRAEPTVPKLAPDQFTQCYGTSNVGGRTSSGDLSLTGMMVCQAEVARDTHIVIEKCLNPKGKNEPPAVIQACTEVLEHDIFTGRDRFYVYANRAEAYWHQGDRPHALDDYNEAVNLSPHNAKLYYNRAIFLLAQPDANAALRDFDTALSLNPTLVPALIQRAQIHKNQDDLGGALSDYSELIRLQPKVAAIWSERGYVCLLQHDYENAVKDEAQAIQLDPKLARAYFFRSAAYKELGDSADARRDIQSAVRLDPSLQSYLTSKEQSPSAEHPH
jgi:Tfp pilus assembly protein PilF